MFHIFFRILGVTTLDIVRANAFVAEAKVNNNLSYLSSWRVGNLSGCYDFSKTYTHKYIPLSNGV